ncbi:hypothetical protein [Plasticicumulans acidivorans]|uniref:Uncharacterized protein n=1 Tax=Plasticicumulans acidivorans TaxID=886464 RepID=A0A317MZW6_9GAMM|nr:hypothetical protein [Plasticicumulans acidivorans]PWV65785.1 hypothetical protein C7443_101270 [Plasticicumulans acidivorans]
MNARLDPRRHAGDIEVVAPWYAADGGCALHRYLDEEFVPRFLGELAAGGPADQRWTQQDRFAGSAQPVLRLPLHGAFYLLACEVRCVQPGRPALDPRRVVDAGCVVRRLDGSGERAWRLAGGRPLGWQPLAADQARLDPHVQRRLVAARRLPASALRAPYDGEEIHPLRAQLARDAGGKAHCVLWGYLPLGGSAPGQRQAPADDDPAALELGSEIAWPLGGRGQWQTADGALLQNGAASAALSGLLRVLVLRYRLGSDGAALQASLAGLAAALPLRQADGSPWQRDGHVYSLLDWLREAESALQEWLNTPSPGSYPPLPAGGGGLSLSLDAATATQWRLALANAREALLGTLQEAIELPRYGQAAGDVYRVWPFVRTLDACGCERVSFGPPSFAFRVAAPWEPEAAKPRVISLPGLDALRRGMARGASFRMPADLGSLLAGLRGKDKAKDALDGNAPQGPAFDFGMLCSFSLPILTICALILLMIVINLLNLVFRWLPFVHICIPWPRREGES